MPIYPGLTIESAFWEGYQAAQDGERMSTNPYPDGEAKESWIDGWAFGGATLPAAGNPALRQMKGWHGRGHQA